MKLSLRLFLVVIVGLSFGLQGTAQKLRPRIGKSKSTISKTAQRSLPEVIDAIRPSVVQIVATVSTSGPSGTTSITLPIGSGFFVTTSHVITARHAIHQATPPGAQSVEFSIGLSYPNLREEDGGSVKGNFQIMPFKVVAEDPAHDFALLQVEGQPRAFISWKGKPLMPTEAVPVRLSADTPTDGLQIAVSGYPLSTNVLMTNVGYVASSWPVVDKHLPGQMNLEDTFAGDVRANQGNSGGPIYSVMSGEVIGVFVSINNALVQTPDGKGGTEPAVLDGSPLLYNSGLINIVPAKYIRELMTKNSIPFNK